ASARWAGRASMASRVVDASISELAPRITMRRDARQRIKLIPRGRETLEMVLATGALGKRKPILRCEPPELRVASAKRPLRGISSCARYRGPPGGRQVGQRCCQS